MRRILLTALSLLNLTFFLASFPYVAHAEIQVEISGNGDNSQNSITTSESNQQETTQSNSAEVTNSIDQSATTGNNETSNNVGDSSIITGSVDTTTDVTNNLNSSVVVSEPCCNGNLDLLISGNGENSQNTISSSVSVTTQVNINNTATISNTIAARADTGSNNAGGNTGSVSITTGNINADVVLVNSSNHSFEKLSFGMGLDTTIKIAGNGENSINDVSLRIFDSLLLVRNNQADISNNVVLDLNTGNNTVNDTVGDVTIKTGDIDAAIAIINDPINTGGTIITCCEKEDEEPPVTPPPAGGDDPKTPPNNPPETKKDGDGGKGGDNVLAAISNILPATGLMGNRSMGMWLVAYLVLFLTGLYVRLRAGRSPAIVKA